MVIETATDLYDNVGRVFYFMGLWLQEAHLKADDPELAQNLLYLRALAAKGAQDVQAARYEFFSAGLQEQGFVPSLHELAEEFTRTTGVDAKLRLKGEIRRLSKKVESVLYRVAYEALMNVERQARATGVTVTFFYDKDQVKLTIRDDGVGIQQRGGPGGWQSSASFGLKSMSKWMAEAGGTLQVSPAQPRGILIEVSLPLTARGASKKNGQ